jgi:hypothetical protein
MCSDPLLAPNCFAPGCLQGPRIETKLEKQMVAALLINTGHEAL